MNDVTNYDASKERNEDSTNNYGKIKDVANYHRQHKKNVI